MSDPGDDGGLIIIFLVCGLIAVAILVVVMSR